MESFPQARFGQERRQAFAGHVVRNEYQRTIGLEALDRAYDRKSGLRHPTQSPHAFVENLFEPGSVNEVRMKPEDLHGLAVGVVEHQQAIAKAVDEARDVTTGKTFGWWRLRQAWTCGRVHRSETYVEVIRNAARIGRRSSLHERGEDVRS
jgi:hypothetical protein